MDEKTFLKHKKINLESYRQGVIDIHNEFVDMLNSSKRQSINLIESEIKKVEEEINHE